MFPQSRLFDMHLCPMITPGVPPIPNVGGPIIGPCSDDTFVGYLPAARITDEAICVGPTDVIVKGSTTVFINYLNAARILDETIHGGIIIEGDFTVIVGG